MQQTLWRYFLLSPLSHTSRTTICHLSFTWTEKKKKKIPHNKCIVDYELSLFRLVHQACDTKKKTVLKTFRVNTGADSARISKGEISPDFAWLLRFSRAFFSRVTLNEVSKRGTDNQYLEVYTALLAFFKVFDISF